MNRTALFVLLLSLAAVSQAGIVYDNGGPNTTNGWYIEYSSWTADDFIIPAGATIRSVDFYFQNYQGIVGWNQDISYQILADNSGPFGSVLASGAGQNVTAVDSGLPWCCGGGNAYQVSFDLQSPFAASAGVRYWLLLTGATGYPSAWWVTTNPNGTPQGYSMGNQVDQLAFALDDGTSAVPEPANLGLLGLGLILFACMRRQKR